MLPPLTPAASSTPGRLTTAMPGQSWQVGTLLDALTLSATERGTVRLQVGSRVFQAHTDLQLTAGQRLQLRVERSADTVVLRTQPADTRPTRIREAIREALPRQQAQAPAVRAVQVALQRPVALPPPLRVALEQFAAQVPQARSLLSAEGLRDAIERSGIFLEKHLAQGASRLPGVDWKAALLRLRAALGQGTRDPAGATPAPNRGNPTPATGGPRVVVAPALPAGNTAALPPPAAAVTPQSAAVSPPAPAPAVTVASVGTGVPSSPVTQLAPPLRQVDAAAQPPVRDVALPADPAKIVQHLARQVEGALSRVQLNQLASINNEPGAARLSWLLELPVQHPQGEVEVLPVRIERDSRRGSDGQISPVWSMNLVFDLGRGGVLRARVVLRDDKVYTTFNADDDQARRQIDNNLEHLRSALTRREIRVGCLSCASYQAPPAEPESTGLLDTRV